MLFHSHFIGPVWITKNRDGTPRRMVAEHGVFEVVMTMRGYSVHAYEVRILCGRWPEDDRDIAALCDRIPLDLFGFKVHRRSNLNEATAKVELYVD